MWETTPLHFYFYLHILSAFSISIETPNFIVLWANFRNSSSNHSSLCASVSMIAVLQMEEALTPQQLCLNLLIHLGRRFIINLILQLGKLPLTQKLFLAKAQFVENLRFLCFLRVHHPSDGYWSSLFVEKRLFELISR